MALFKKRLKNVALDEADGSANSSDNPEPAPEGASPSSASIIDSEKQKVSEKIGPSPSTSKLNTTEVASTAAAAVGRSEESRPEPEPRKRPQVVSIVRQDVVPATAITIQRPAIASTWDVSNRMTVCFVCGERAKPDQEFIKNYGGVSCFSCRAFFRRAAQSEKTKAWFCVSGGQCTLTVDTRLNCKKCRYFKCLEAGMEPELVLNPDQRKHRFRRQIAKGRRTQLGQQGQPDQQGQQDQPSQEGQLIQEGLEGQQDLEGPVIQQSQIQLSHMNLPSQPGHVMAVQGSSNAVNVHPVSLFGAAFIAGPCQYEEPRDLSRARVQADFRHLGSKKDIILKSYLDVFAEATHAVSYEQAGLSPRDRLLDHITRVCDLFRLFAASLR